MIKKLLIETTIIALLTLAPMSSYAIEKHATEESVREMMNLTGAGNIGIQVMQRLLTELRPIFSDVPDSFWDEVMQEVNPDELVSLIVPVYQKHFTEKEIRQLIKFYKSPIGRKVIQSLPQITQDSMDAGQQWGQALALRIIDKAKARKEKSRDEKPESDPSQ